MKFSLPVQLAILLSLGTQALGVIITETATEYTTVTHTSVISTVEYSTIVVTATNDGTTELSTEVTSSEVAVTATSSDVESTETSSTAAAATTTADTETTSSTASPVTTSSLTSTTSTSASSSSSSSSSSEVTTTSATSTSASASASLSTFASEILEEHNSKRALNQAPALTWNSTLETYAANYASEYDCSSGVLEHSDGPYGENLALGYDTIPAVDAWYDEISLYNFSDPGFSESTGHFTQVVWVSSVQLGCAYKDCGSYYGQYTICEYSPAGNVLGEFAENVLPTVSSS